MKRGTGFDGWTHFVGLFVGEDVASVGKAVGNVDGDGVGASEGAEDGGLGHTSVLSVQWLKVGCSIVE